MTSPEPVAQPDIEELQRTIWLAKDDDRRQKELMWTFIRAQQSAIAERDATIERHDALRQVIEDELLRDFPEGEQRRELPSLETLVEYAVVSLEKGRHHLGNANRMNKRHRATIKELEESHNSHVTLELMADKDATIATLRTALAAILAERSRQGVIDIARDALEATSDD